MSLWTKGSAKVPVAKWPQEQFLYYADYKNNAKISIEYQHPSSLVL